MTFPDAWRAAGWRDPAEPPPKLDGLNYSALVLTWAEETHGETMETTRYWYKQDGSPMCWGGQTPAHAWRQLCRSPKGTERL